MRKIHDKNGLELATVLSVADYMQKTGKLFFSDPEDPIQVGSLFFPAGSDVAAHLHKRMSALDSPMEVLLVLCGCPLANIFDASGTLVESFTLKVGDILIQKRGGHGFCFSSGTALLEIKRGPYHGKGSDKEPI